MRVKKRNGDIEEVSFDKVIHRLRSLCEMTPKLHNVEVTEIAQKVCSRIYDGVTTTELDELAGEQCTEKSVQHLEYSTLASRIIISNNQKITSPSFSETIYILFHNKDVHGKHYPLISEQVYRFVLANKNKINDYIDYSRDFNFDYFGFKTLEKAYLMKINGKIVERVQHLIMRVSLGIHSENLKDALETYDMISSKYFTHATPTLFHSGTPRPQLLSCFLLGVEDSVHGMYKAIADCAKISKWAGGIGLHIHDIRGNNAKIRSTNGKSNGIVPMLKVYNEVARHINQSGKRNGSFAIYLEPHHPDILAFLEAKKNHGDENARARDLFYAVWLSDLFMKRVKNNEQWSLMCPDKCKGLSNIYGDEFERRYIELEKDPENIVEQLPAITIWKELLVAQMETGTPYICYKDASNKKSNQQNIGTIKSSNLCTEIIEYSDHKEYACCTLASIALGSFVVPFDTSLIKSVKVYSKTDCTFCTYTKRYLESYGVCVEEINLDDETKRNSFFAKLNSQCDDDDEFITTVPQIYINNNHIGGFNALFKYLKPTYDFKKLHAVTKVVTNNLDTIIDINFYPVIETFISNTRHRPLGIGVQGLADVYAMFKYSFDSDDAKELNKQIFATIYHAACEKSTEIAAARAPIIQDFKSRVTNLDIIPEYYSKEFTFTNLKTNSLYHKSKPARAELNRDTHLGSYSTFIDSPIHKGKFQFDLWGIEPITKAGPIDFQWDVLRNKIQEYGIRNSLLLAPMPTASTSQILGFNECIEPFTSNIYSRGTLAGQFLVINKYLQSDLIRIGLWDDKLKDQIILDNGSIANITDIPAIIKQTYQIAWDLSMKSLIDQAADRCAYVCQSQSLNLWLKNPDFSKLSSMHFYSWSKGLKTGMYYLRRRATAKAQTFSIEVQEEPECLMCSS
jgi:ribonucleoside-diphosphate reductase alpha subunit